MLRSILRLNLQSYWRLGHLGVISVVCFVIGWHGADEAIAWATLGDREVALMAWDGFFVALAGPGVWNDFLLHMLKWFIPHLLFFYFIGEHANGELLQRGYSVVPLIGSRLRWWGGKIAALWVFTLAYTLVSLTTVLVVALMRLPWSTEGSTLLNAGELFPGAVPMSARALFGWEFALLSSTLLAMASVQTVIAIITRRSVYGFAAISILAVLSWLLGIDHPQLVPLLPGSQSMLLRHTPLDPSVPGFYFTTSLLYNAALALTAIGIGAWHVKHMDIFGATDAR